MMPLGVLDAAVIILTGAGCAALMTLIAVLLLRRMRGSGLMARFVVVGAASVLAMASSVVAIALEMYISPHDLTVLVWIAATGFLCAVITAVLTARAARSSLSGIAAAVRRVGEGDVVDVEQSGWREFDDLSIRLAETSQKLSEAHAEVERLDSDRRRFLAWISHDLRTPLTAIRALAESMEEGVMDDVAAFPRRVRVQVEAMGRMVDDLFELSRITSGAIRLRTEQVELLDVVSDAVADLRSSSAQRDVQIVQRDVAGHVVWADPHQLARVVTNLLTNAVRHAPRGSEVVVSAEALDEGRLVLAVLDHGGGVAVEDLDRMFEVGWRADAARSTDADGIASGAGLGLAIARGLVRAHGGDVYAERTGDGFCMKVLLPTDSREPVE
ncbi:HAMP domain-containing sensor histidine kinase [Microbacterium pseudoresistens]|uniref:Sensor-like histidine kinase SenX3 n=1 Tax=Microbacterium pseudoresistens TaxID=640634 RepID=A0A7Y9JMR6_9MICO|nr:HAMP domain-containing sensor histidine kinase [Microbacterium pseudoresistens]NYD54306.1 signal transduction histidine kinase [Microbacterium pseudoresistens]